jgi:hypothetical protein
MSLPPFPRRPAHTPNPILTEPPGPWPVDTTLSRRVADARRRLERTRKALARRAPSERRPRSERSCASQDQDQAGPAARAAKLGPASSRPDPASQPLPRSPTR